MSMNIINHGTRYAIPEDLIPKESILRVMLHTSVGITKDENGDIIFNDVPGRAFRSYMSFMSFYVDFEWDNQIVEWFSYLGHTNNYSYPIDYWKIKLIDDHDVEFKYLGGIDRIQYLTGGDPMKFIQEHGTKKDDETINIYLDKIFEYNRPHIYYSDKHIIARYITIFNYLNGIIWFDFDKIQDKQYIYALLQEALEHHLELKFPMLNLTSNIIGDGLKKKIKHLYSTIEYNGGNIAMELYVSSTIKEHDIIDISDYGWEYYYDEYLRGTTHHMIEELLADYLDRTDGTTLEKLRKYNSGDMFEIRSGMLLDNFNIESLFELAKNMKDPDYNKKSTLRDQMNNLYSWYKSSQYDERDFRHDIDKIYQGVPHDPMSIMLLVTIYGLDIDRLMSKIEPISDDITMEEFYNMSPLIMDNKPKHKPTNKTIMQYLI